MKHLKGKRKHPFWKYLLVFIFLATIVYFGLALGLKWWPFGEKDHTKPSGPSGPSDHTKWMGLKPSIKPQECGNCKTNTDCKSNRCPTCVNDKCKAVNCGDGCNVNSDCARSENCFNCVDMGKGKVCASTTQICGACTHPSDCKYSLCPFCVNGKCFSSGCKALCNKSADCKDQDCPFCVSGECSNQGCNAQCDSSTLCASVAGCTDCRDGKCQKPIPVCPSHPLDFGSFSLYTLATGTGKILSYNSNNNQLTFTTPGSPGSFQTVTFSKNGDLSISAISGDTPTFIIIDTSKQLNVASTSATQWIVDGCGMIYNTKNNLMLASSGDDLIVRTYDKDAWKNNENIFIKGALPPTPSCDENYTKPEDQEYYHIFNKRVGPSYFIGVDTKVYIKAALGHFSDAEERWKVSKITSSIAKGKNYIGISNEQMSGVYTSWSYDTNDGKFGILPSGNPPVPNSAVTQWFTYDEKCGLISDAGKRFMLQAFKVPQLQDYYSLIFIPYDKNGWLDDRNVFEFVKL